MENCILNGETADPCEVGGQIGGYVLLSRCGGGACGEVFLARSVITGRRFALKVIRRQGDRELAGIIRYQNAALHTPLMQIRHVGREGDLLYYVMDAADDLNDGAGEYLPDTLLNRMERRGRIPAAELRPLASELAEDLTLLHRKGLCHRDIKPGNILFFDGRAALGDIGLAAPGASGTLVGTVGFIHPEVLAGIRPFAPADDFFALGRTLYCALTGEPPERYPAFPAALDLKEAGEIVALYNRWCAGECVMPSVRRRRAGAWRIAAAVLPAAVCIAGIVFLPRRGKPEELPAANVPAVTVNIREYWTELERMADPSRIPEDFVRMLPELRRTRERWWREKTAAGVAAFNAPVTAAEIEAMAIRPGKADHAEFYVRSERQDAAFAAFDAAHRKDPSWMFFEIDDRIGAEITRIRGLKDIPELRDHYDCGADLGRSRELFRRRDELIGQIVKNFKKSAE